MIELGKRQLLEVVRTKDFGVYLGEKSGDEAAVLLPKKQVPEGTKIGDKLEVFIYKDSEDRLIATTGTPKLQVGEVGVLKVKNRCIFGYGAGERPSASVQGAESQGSSGRGMPGGSVCG